MHWSKCYAYFTGKHYICYYCYFCIMRDILSSSSSLSTFLLMRKLKGICPMAPFSKWWGHQKWPELFGSTSGHQKIWLEMLGLNPELLPLSLGGHLPDCVLHHQVPVVFPRSNAFFAILRLRLICIKLPYYNSAYWTAPCFFIESSDYQSPIYYGGWGRKSERGWR